MSFWNPARVEQLRELITREGSAAQIAAELNRGSIEFVTRNAVISKIHRQGWIDVWARAGHPGPVRGTPAPVRVKAPRPAHAATASAASVRPSGDETLRRIEPAICDAFMGRLRGMGQPVSRRAVKVLGVPRSATSV